MGTMSLIGMKQRHFVTVRGLNMHKQVLLDMFLDYFNNYLTIEKFAEHNEITVDQARALVTVLYDIYEADVKFHRSIK